MWHRVATGLRRWPAALPLGAFALLFLVLDHAIVGGDGMAMYVVAESLLRDGDFDLSNQFAAYAEPIATAFPYAIVRVPETGGLASMFPFGVALFWAPFLAVAWTLEAWGFFRESYWVYGYSLPGTFRGLGLAVVVAANVYLLLAWRLGARLAARTTARLEAEAISFLFAVGTPLLFYATIEPSYAHVVAAFLTSWLVWLWVTREGDRFQSGLSIGLVAGLGILVRWNLAPYVLVFGAADLLRGHVRRSAGMAVGVASLVWLIGYSWFEVAGSFWHPPLLSVEPGFLAVPRPWAMLASDLRGLVPWSPIAGLGVAGLGVGLLERRPRAGTFLLCVFAQLCVNSLARDWWASHSFGHRRLVNLYPLLVVGGAWLVDAGGRLVRAQLRMNPSWGRLCCLFVLGLAAWHTFVLALHYYPSRLVPESMSHSELARDWRQHGSWGELRRYYVDRQREYGLLAAWWAPQESFRRERRDGDRLAPSIRRISWSGGEVVVEGDGFGHDVVINLFHEENGVVRNLGGESRAGRPMITFKVALANRLAFVPPRGLEGTTVSVQLADAHGPPGAVSAAVPIRIPRRGEAVHLLHPHESPRINGVGRLDGRLRLVGVGLSTDTVVNLFQEQSGQARNLGGLSPERGPVLRVLEATPNRLLVEPPPGLLSGAFAIQVVNPPFTPEMTSNVVDGTW